MDNYKHYISEHKFLCEKSYNQSNLYDCSLIISSLGIFIATIFFITFKEISNLDYFYLLLGWGFHFFSIAFTLCSLVTAQYSHMKQIDINNDAYSNGKYPSLENNIFRTFTSVFNVFSIISFLGGMFYVLLFLASTLIGIK